MNALFRYFLFQLKPCIRKIRVNIYFSLTNYVVYLRLLFSEFLFIH